jgi:transcription initiation factor TFIIIB Brf1 subunit/transcription initiation factor TFIIB
MQKISVLKLGTICTNCGSQNVAKTSGKTEDYCKNCGTVSEELLQQYE